MSFLQALLNGIALAAVYALLGMGFVIIYKSMQVLSFAQPALILFGGWWIIYFATVVSLNFYLAVLIAVVIAALSGLFIERVFLRPMVGKPVFAVAIMTIGLDLAVRVVAGNFYNVGGNTTGDPWGLNTHTFWGIGVVMNHRRAWAIVAAAVLVAGLLAFFRFSRMGLAMRAAAFDQEVALIQGVSVAAVFAISWAMASVLATVASLFINPDLGSLTPNSYALALKALPVVVIGGLDSIGGTLVAALLVGVAEALTGTYQSHLTPYIGQNFSQVVPYLVMFFVLLIRPYGLFGTREVERV